MGDYQAFLNKKSFTKGPTLVDDKGGIISNKLSYKKLSNYVDPPFKPFLDTSVD
jgi:hypothetical protein